MKKLMVDMDNVITDGRYLDYINEFLNTDYKLENQTEYYLQDLVGDRVDEFWKEFGNKNVYQDAPLIEGCYKALEELNKKYEVYIVTAYFWGGSNEAISNNIKDKYNYLTEKLPFISPQNFIFTSNKHLIDSDIVIDDRINNLSNGKLKLLFNAWHNRNISNDEIKEKGIVRVYNWNDVLREIENYN